MIKLMFQVGRKSCYCDRWCSRNWEATVRLFTKNGAKVVIADVEDDTGTVLANTLSPSAI